MEHEIINEIVEETTEKFVLRDELTLKNAAIAAGGALIFEAVKLGAKKVAPFAAKGVNKVKGLFKKNKEEVVEDTENE